MPEYDNRNTGIAWKNKDKQSDKHADYKGYYTDGEGREFFLDVWFRTPKAGGDEFFSIKTKLKEKQGGGQRSGGNSKREAKKPWE